MQSNGGFLSARDAARHAVRNIPRPPLLAARALHDRDGAYYNCRPGLRSGHDAILRLARERGCSRIGLFLGEDGWDYPLTWRAMRAGAEVRHVGAGDPWPCLVYAQEPSTLPAATGWSALELPSVLAVAPSAPAPAEALYPVAFRPTP